MKNLNSKNLQETLDKPAIEPYSYSKCSLVSDESNINEILNDYNIEINIILFVDGNKKLWELVRRDDLDFELINKNPSGVTSFNKLKPEINEIKNNTSIEENMDFFVESFNHSESNISERNNFSRSIIRDTNNDISDIY